MELYRRDLSETEETPQVHDERHRVKNIHSQSFRNHAKRIIRSLEELENEDEKPFEKRGALPQEANGPLKRRVERSARYNISTVNDKDTAKESWPHIYVPLRDDDSDSESSDTTALSGLERLADTTLEQEQSGSADLSGWGASGDQQSEHEQRDDIKDGFADLSGSGLLESTHLRAKVKESEREQGNESKDEFLDLYGSGSGSGLSSTELKDQGANDKTSDPDQRDDMKNKFVDLSGSGADSEFSEMRKQLEALERRYKLLVHNDDLVDSLSGSGEQSLSGSASGAENEDSRFASLTSYESQMMSDHFESREGQASGSAVLADILSSASGAGDLTVKDTGPTRETIQESEGNGESDLGSSSPWLQVQASGSAVLADILSSASGAGDLAVKNTGPTRETIQESEGNGESDLGSLSPWNTKGSGSAQGNLESLFHELKRDMRKIFHGEVEDYLKAFNKHLEQTKMEDNIEKIESSRRKTYNRHGSRPFPSNVNRVSVSDRPKNARKEMVVKLPEASLERIHKARRIHNEAKLNGLRPWGLGVDKTAEHQHAIVHNSGKLSSAKQKTAKLKQIWGLGTIQWVSNRLTNGKNGTAWKLRPAAVGSMQQDLDNKNRTKVRQWQVTAVGDGINTKSKANHLKNKSHSPILKNKNQTSETKGTHLHDNKHEKKEKDKNTKKKKSASSGQRGELIDTLRGSEAFL